MDQELKTWLAGMESRLLAHVDGVEERSRAQLQSVENRFLGQVEGLENRFRGHIEQSEERSCAHTEIVETRLLKEFWKWARTADARYRQHQANVSGLDIRVQAIEDRLSDLDRTLPSKRFGSLSVITEREPLQS